MPELKPGRDGWPLERSAQEASQGCIKLQLQGPAKRGGEQLVPGAAGVNIGDKLSPPLKTELDAALYPPERT